jgi:hypothetical protein
MKTAVRNYRSSDITCEILYSSEPFENSGDKLLFSAGSIVVYAISQGKKRKAFLFRTGPDGSDILPGVYPAVNLLVQAKTREKVTRLLKVIASLSRRKMEIVSLSDSFFLRVNVLIENRDFKIKDALAWTQYENFTPP